MSAIAKVEKDVVVAVAKQGCTLKITYRTAGRRLYESDVSDWLSGSSGLSQEYSKKILAFGLYFNKYVRILFDSTVNCLEAMQQIRNNTINSKHIFVYKTCVTGISCPHGQFNQVTLHPKNSLLLSIAEARELLRPYGHIYSLEHARTGAILNGRVRAVMFVPADVQLWECDAEETVIKQIDIEWFNPCDVRINKEFVQAMWDKYGPNSTTALAIRKNE